MKALGRLLLEWFVEVLGKKRQTQSLRRLEVVVVTITAVVA